MALDASGTPHISFNDSASGVLNYAYRSSTGWQIETVDGVGSGTLSSIIVDAQGVPHIIYTTFEPQAKVVKHAYRSSSGWQIETVDSNTGVIVDGPSLALDSDGTAHVSYYVQTSGWPDPTRGELRYASRDQTGWRVEVVDQGGEVGLYSSLKIDAQNRPHLSYYDKTNRTLKYATQSAGRWSRYVVERVSTLFDSGGGSNLVLDASGAPYIGYGNATNCDSVYATPLVLTERVYLPLVVTR